MLKTVFSPKLEGANSFDQTTRAAILQQRALNLLGGLDECSQAEHRSSFLNTVKTNTYVFSVGEVRFKDRAANIAYNAWRKVIREVNVGQILKERGLTLSEEKTHITHIKKGFDFLGWNFRKYNGKLLVKPSKGNVKNHLTKIRQTIKAN